MFYRVCLCAVFYVYAACDMGRAAWNKLDDDDDDDEEDDALKHTG